MKTPYQFIQDMTKKDRAKILSTMKGEGFDLFLEYLQTLVNLSTGEILNKTPEEFQDAKNEVLALKYQIEQTRAFRNMIIDFEAREKGLKNKNVISKVAKTD